MEERANWIKQGFKQELTAKLTAKLGVELSELTDVSIVEIRVQKFLTSQSMLLKMIPPTHGAFLQHLKRATYATIVDKTPVANNAPTCRLWLDRKEISDGANHVT